MFCPGLSHPRIPESLLSTHTHTHTHTYIHTHSISQNDLKKFLSKINSKSLHARAKQIFQASV